MATTLAPAIGSFCAPVTTPPMPPVVTPCAARTAGSEAAQNERTANAKIKNLR
jgi:hypothetical protein